MPPMTPHQRQHLDDPLTLEDQEQTEAMCSAIAAEGGLERVRNMILRGDPLTPRHVAVANAWVAAKECEDHEEWLVRTPEGAAVRQADAAERAALAAEKSARWAGWAIAVSLAALALAAWPFIQPLIG